MIKKAAIYLTILVITSSCAVYQNNGVYEDAKSLEPKSYEVSGTFTNTFVHAFTVGAKSKINATSFLDIGLEANYHLNCYSSLINLDYMSGLYFSKSGIQNFQGKAFTKISFTDNIAILLNGSYYISNKEKNYWSLHPVALFSIYKLNNRVGITIFGGYNHLLNFERYQHSFNVGVNMVGYTSGKMVFRPEIGINVIFKNGLYHNLMPSIGVNVGFQDTWKKEKTID